MSVIDAQALDKFKAAQRDGWKHFIPLETHTTAPAARLVRFAGVHSGQRVLDVGCGTGVVAITAAKTGARASGLDLTPELLERARENARLTEANIDFREGDAEQLPYADREFDVVLSQFGHMFAPRPDVCVSEMLRVLKPGGTIAFSTWPPELFIGRLFLMIGRYMPPPPPGVRSPAEWGDPNNVRERLGSGVKDLTFERESMLVPTLSARHARTTMEQTAGPVIRLVAMLEKSDPAKLEAFRREYETLASEYLRENEVRQGYLMSRAIRA
jgi:SAM-dependent methyltransferase